MAQATQQHAIGSPARDLAPLQLLPWCSALLLVLYGLGVINSIIPLQLTTPQWQLRFCEALVNQSPLVLMALSVAVLAQRVQVDSAGLRRIVRWSTRAALPLTLGFALLIPLQGAASLTLLQNANRSSDALVKESDRKLATLSQAIRQAPSSAALQSLINSLPGGLPPVEKLGRDLGSQQQQLITVLTQLRGRTVLTVQLNRQRQQTLLLRNSLRLTLLAALLALVFQQLRPPRQRSHRPAFAWPRLRWWPGRRKSQPTGAMAAELARYCNDDTQGRG